ncbi:hypothetical protein CONCODRAFT_6411 [Conidiobolus coronatus NRRL 28638]|uniref:RNI-like protein n=1 Tax=Conidiobolus coronatus (strain ATCC 28846 / CBS 209.66 / NRRL 28638) TaxID=796925 RepID=A0A137P7P6_CONC2|nr:hypothetical protein CONCODRAFT_6411 [Conidiobolus coronatus NRRL 28638]|eukprot:KXN70964.1 hypothetical protein CONCODRAFT_6411 [Conidiobolus coronatus NRRL 28638]
MSKIDIKLSYNLLSSNNILKYLLDSEKCELSYSCKYIYDKCSIIRLQKLDFNSIHYQSYLDITQKGVYWGDDNYMLKLEYFDDMVNKYKERLLSLNYGHRDYFLIEHFSLKFINLSSFCLYYIEIPITNLKNIIKNLKNLHFLSLIGLTVPYSKNCSQVVDFEFSKYLKELTWGCCYQFELDSTDYLSINQHSRAPSYVNESMLNISLNLITTLKHLEWSIDTLEDAQLFNEAIANNPELISLKAILHCFEWDSFKPISSSKNLTKLSISSNGYSFISDNSMLSKLSNIKALELLNTYDDVAVSIDLLITNCPNLEELSFSYFGNYDEPLIRYIKNIVNLKALIIDCYADTYLFLDSILPESNLEKLEVITYNPIKFNFNNFINMKKLKFVTNSFKVNNFEDKNEIYKQEGLEGWRVITYLTSIWYWKTK